MSLVGAISSLQTPGPYPVTRRTAGDYVDGKYVVGPTALVVADDIVEVVDIVEDTLELTAHGLVTGDGPFQLTTLDTLPAGLALATDYWVVRVDNDLIQLAATLEDALAFPDAVVVDITDVGVDTHTLMDTADTVRQNLTIFGIVASLQPVTGRELAELPEGQNGDEVRVFWTTTLIQTRVPGFEPDEVEFDGEVYYVYIAKRWQGLGETHYEVYASRTEVP